jgi:hypothetical protein
MLMVRDHLDSTVGLILHAVATSRNIEKLGRPTRSRRVSNSVNALLLYPGSN